MVEIFTLGWFARQIGSIAQAKGYPARKYHLLAQMLWIIGEAAGLFTGLALAPTYNPLSLVMIYLCALCGAALGAGAAYSIARGLKPEMVRVR